MTIHEEFLTRAEQRARQHELIVKGVMHVNIYTVSRDGKTIFIVVNPRGN